MYLRFQPMEHYDDVNANFKKKNLGNRNDIATDRKKRLRNIV